METYRYCTPEWLRACAEAYPTKPQFQEAFARLATKICFRIEATPQWGLEEDIIFCAFMDHGDLQELRFFSEEEAAQVADFVVTASPQEWKQVLRKERKFVGEFMFGRITLEQGSKVGVLAIASYADAFVDALTQFSLQFPDEMSPEELDAYAAYQQEFRAELGV
jgi:hypothetical protein